MRPLERTVDPDVKIHLDSDKVAKVVANDPFAIGITSFAATGETRILSLTSTCGFLLGASRQTIKTEDYPLMSPMSL